LSRRHILNKRQQNVGQMRRATVTSPSAQDG
jgi:hypothetical protein